jgi:hypothetical protein
MNTKLLGRCQSFDDPSASIAAFKRLNQDPDIVTDGRIYPKTKKLKFSALTNDVSGDSADPPNEKDDNAIMKEDIGRLITNGSHASRAVQRSDSPISAFQPSNSDRSSSDTTIVAAATTNTATSSSIDHVELQIEYLRTLKKLYKSIQRTNQSREFLDRQQSPRVHSNNDNQYRSQKYQCDHTPIQSQTKEVVRTQVIELIKQKVNYCFP